MPSRDPQVLTPLLQEVWAAMKQWVPAVHDGWEVFLTCTHRTVEEQGELYKRGRTISLGSGILTNCDGIKVKSKHNCLPSRAFDFAIKHHGLVVWGDSYFDAIGRELENAPAFKGKIRWGGSFKSIKDRPHVEEV